jgi:hypothetical protein
LLCGAASAQSAYRWVDENGQVHYSDRPMPGATEIELRSVQGYSTPTRIEPSQSEGAASAEPAQPYRVFNVIRPAQQETLWNTGGTLNVELELEPGLQPGHRISVYLDGQRRDLSTTGLSVTLEEVWRGQHTLQAVIVDAAGNEVLRSLPATFMVQQTSIQNPNNTTPPARPRPTPSAGGG